MSIYSSVYFSDASLIRGKLSEFLRITEGVKSIFSHLFSKLLQIPKRSLRIVKWLPSPKMGSLPCSKKNE
ncbi:MAG: hypothetical protein DCF14_06545 [Phormidesmis priestleyi]|nr:MAG: hypothetical protein DCF14_06545 [Phormidesmis priestleyi]